jgi:hypothetical protein
VCTSGRQVRTTCEIRPRSILELHRSLARTAACLSRTARRTWQPLLAVPFPEEILVRCTEIFGEPRGFVATTTSFSTGTSRSAFGGPANFHGHENEDWNDPDVPFCSGRIRLFVWRNKLLFILETGFRLLGQRLVRLNARRGKAFAHCTLSAIRAHIHDNILGRHPPVRRSLVQKSSASTPGLRNEFPRKILVKEVFDYYYWSRAKIRMASFESFFLLKSNHTHQIPKVLPKRILPNMLGTSFELLMVSILFPNHSCWPNFVWNTNGPVKVPLLNCCSDFGVSSRC